MLQKFTKVRLILVLQLCIFLLFTAGCGTSGSIDAEMEKTGSAALTQQSGEASTSSYDEVSGESTIQSGTEITNEPAAQVLVKNANQTAQQEFQNKSSRSGSQTTVVSTSKPSTQATNGGKNVIYSTLPLGSNVMPIGAWVAPPPANALPKLNNPDYINKDTYRNIKESGINIIYALYESFPDRRSDIMRALDSAKANGIKYLVRDSNIMGGIDEIEMLESAVELYKNHTAFAGHNIQDEPGMNTFENYKYLHENYKKVLPDKLFYINLLPTYSTAAQRERGASASGSGKASYNDYLNSYIRNVNPKVISYDYYPLSGSFPKLDSGYYENMSIIRKRSMEKGIPFWVFIQSCSFGSGTRTPTEPEIQWQVNTALAYGAKGIQYFTYWTPLEFQTTEGAMVTKTGEKTKVYYYVQKTNKQIAAVDQILLNSKNEGIIINKESGPAIPKGDRLTSYNELIKVEGDTPVIIGCFKSKGKSVFYVVNNTIDKNGQVTLKFKKSISMNIIQDAKPLQKKGGSISLSLNAGSGALIEVR